MIIEVNNLKKEYKTYQRGHTFKDALKSLFNRKKIIINALKGISFSIQKGEIVGFIGPNGAGKSTTIKILTGVLYPTSGEVNVNNYIPWKERRKFVSNIGVVFGQKSQLIWDVPPVDSFYMNQAIYGISPKDYHYRLDKMVELLKLKDVVNKPTRQLSLGERIKCEFIMAILHKPDILFLDEPTIGLDIVSKESIRDFIKEINKEGVSIILTTHDLSDIEELSERVVIINYGEILFDGSLSDIKKLYGDKKKVYLKTDKPVITDHLSGIENYTTLNNHEVELELDLSKVSINDFFNTINKNYTIIDLSLDEPPIESVIKQFYM